MSIALTAACAVLVLVLLCAEHRRNQPLRLVVKTTAAACFVAVGWLHAIRTPVDPAWWVVVGLVLGALGDVCLALPGKRWFAAGIVVFFLGHVAYLAAFHVWLPATEWLTVWAVPPTVVAVLVTVYVWPHTGKLRWPVNAYIALFTTLAVAATAILGQHPGHLAALGALVFFASDIAVARQRFVVESFGNKLFGLPLYFGGQLLFAWSLVGSTA